MDEPTNHLDVMNVKWVKDYLLGLVGVTCIMVSHDSGLLDDVCSHIVQIENLKLHMFAGNLSSFVEKVPEARSYFQVNMSSLSKICFSSFSSNLSKNLLHRRCRTQSRNLLFRSPGLLMVSSPRARP
jgi:ATPase subunit of ABC transporter with duplicated ATPase domains